MKKSALRHIIRESIQELLTEQTTPISQLDSLYASGPTNGVTFQWSVCKSETSLFSQSNSLGTNIASTNCCTSYTTQNNLMTYNFNYLNQLADLLYINPGQYNASGIVSPSSNLKPGVFDSTGYGPTSNANCLDSGCDWIGPNVCGLGTQPVGPFATPDTDRRTRPNQVGIDNSGNPIYNEPSNLNRRG
jgi:hypothetical protein